MIHPQIFEAETVVSATAVPLRSIHEALVRISGVRTANVNYIEGSLMVNVVGGDAGEIAELVERLWPAGELSFMYTR